MEPLEQNSAEHMSPAEEVCIHLELLEQKVQTGERAMSEALELARRLAGALQCMGADHVQADSRCGALQGGAAEGTER